ncbi:hypothetical protein OSG_eHP8_00230 [environmental Halophage eHP-8]|nr:hypothetical protein OSG_eHP8_00230 [environmental Halophage eHP-8]AFH21971.1 hypothetical protein OSG_eHP13_00235 [environmental Halophage eHP-13]
MKWIVTGAESLLHGGNPNLTVLKKDIVLKSAITQITNNRQAKTLIRGIGKKLSVIIAGNP